MTPRGLAWALAFGVVAAGCAPIPRPSVLGEIEQIRAGASAVEARRYAPDAFAHAEKLRREAGAAFDVGDRAGSELLGERAVAAYAHAHALARVARAEAAGAEAARLLETGKASLAALEADQARVNAELDALDMRIKVARDAQPVVPSGIANGEREQARKAAARALSVQARMLCGAARLLSIEAPASPVAGAASGAPDPSAQAGGAPVPQGAPVATQLDEATAALAKLDEALSATGPAPIDQASRVRAACLSALTAARRAATPVSRAPGVGDALLADLSAAGTWSPVRDDRGVVITLRGLFTTKGLTPAGEARLRDLSRVAAAHPSFPVAVVVHTERDVTAKDEASWKARAEAVVQALKSGQGGGAVLPNPRIEPLVVGAAAPVVDPRGSDRARNARVEVIFVTPEML